MVTGAGLMQEPIFYDVQSANKAACEYLKSCIRPKQNKHMAGFMHSAQMFDGYLEHFNRDGKEFGVLINGIDFKWMKHKVKSIDVSVMGFKKEPGVEFDPRQFIGRLG